MSVIRDNWRTPALAYARDTIEELSREPADLAASADFRHGGASRLLRRGR